MSAAFRVEIGGQTVPIRFQTVSFAGVRAIVIADITQDINARAAKAANLSDLASAASARTNIGADLAANVNFTPAGTGAAVRTVQAKLREASVSVDDYGAVGDGVADDQPAIVTAQNALFALGGGELLFTYGKKYRVANPVQMLRGITYKGTGKSGIGQWNDASGAQIIPSGTAAFTNHATLTISEVKFENLFFRSIAPNGGNIWDWSLGGIVAKIEIAGCSILQENAGKYIIRGTSAAGVHTIYIHDFDYQYATGNTVPPIYFAAPAINSIVIQRFWSQCTNQETSGTYSMWFESTSATGPGLGIVLRDGVVELPGGGSVNMLSCWHSGIENVTVYDLTIAPNNPMFNIGKGATGLAPKHVWMKGCRSVVGTTTKPDVVIDCSLTGSGNYVIQNCNFNWLDGISPVPAIQLIGSEINNAKNVAYTSLGASPTGDIHFGTTSAGGKSYKMWNGYPGNFEGYLNITQNDVYFGSIHPSGLWQWGGTRTAPACRIAPTGEINTTGGVFPGTPAGAIQFDCKLLAGLGAPANANGTNNDYYFRGDGTVTGGNLLYHKEAGAWITVAGYLFGSATYDAPSIAASGTTTTAVTVTGAALGDLAVCSFGVSLGGLVATAYVSAADTVTVVLFNPTGAAIDLASTTLRARVWKV